MSKPGLDWDDWYTPDASAGGGGSADTGGGGSADVPIDWRDPDAESKLYDLFGENEVTTSNLELFIGILGKTKYDEIIIEINKIRENNKTPGLTLNIWGHTVGSTMKYVQIWVVTKYVEMYGESILKKELQDLIDDCGGINPLSSILPFLKKMLIAIDLHSNFMIKNENNLDENDYYKNAIEVMLNASIGTPHYYSSSVFDGLVRGEISTQDARNVLSTNVKTLFQKYKLLKYTNIANVNKEKEEKLNAIAEKNAKIKNKTEAAAVAKAVNKIEEIENIDENNDTQSQKLDIINSSQSLTEEDKLLETIKVASETMAVITEVAESNTPYSQTISQMKSDLMELTTVFENLSNKPKDKSSDELKDLYLTHRYLQNSFMKLLNPSRALFLLGKMIFSGTNDDSGKSFVIYPDISTEEKELFTYPINQYLKYSCDKSSIGKYQTPSAIPFFIDIDAGINYNLWKGCRTTKYGWKTPSFMLFLCLTAILQKNKGNIPKDLVPTFFLLLVDDFTAKTTDNFFAETLRNDNRKSQIVSSMMYEMLNKVGIEFGTMIGSCLSIPRNMEQEDFAEMSRSFLKYIPDEKKHIEEEKIRLLEETWFVPSATPEELTTQIFWDKTQTSSSPLELKDLQTNSQNNNPSTAGGESSQSFLFDHPIDEGGHNEFAMTMDPSIGGGSHNESAMTMNPPTGGGWSSELFQYVNPIDEGNEEDGGINPVVIEEDSNSQNINEDQITLYQQDDPVAENQVIPLSQKNLNKPCYAFQKGECARGSSCVFSHGQNANANDKGVGVCSEFLQTGTCIRGENCRFSHYKRGGSIRTTKRIKKGGRKTRRPKKNKRTRRTKDRAKYTRKR